MNIDYIISEYDVICILKNETPIYKLTINSKDFIKVYKLNNLFYIGVYSEDILNDSLDDEKYKNISYLYNDTREKIKQLNIDCFRLHEAIKTLTEYEIFEEVDIQHYQQKFNDKLRNKFEQFVNIVSNL